MALLGINTATDILGLALVEDEKLLWEYASAQREEADRLGLMIKDLLKKNGQDFSVLTAVAVAAGPGSFTGLRLGVVAAKTLAQSLDIPVVGLPTLEVLAWQNRMLKGLLVTAVRARSGEYHAALWGARGGSYARLSPDFLAETKKLARRLAQSDGPVWLAAPDQAVWQDLPAKSKKSGLIVPADGRLTASAVAWLGQKSIKEGKSSDLFRLAPEYSRPPLIKKMSARNKFQPKA